MNYFALLIAALFSYKTLSAEPPKCSNGKWLGQDIVLFTGGDNCNNRIAVCNFHGTRSEGWYSYAKDKGVTLTSADCSNTYNKPECIELNGTEEISIGSHTLRIGSCSNLDIVCVRSIRSHDKWMAYPTNDRRLVNYGNCAE